jgi:hypothetical protein
VGIQTKKVGSYWLDRASLTFFLVSGCSFWFLDVLGTEVDDARDGSWRHCFTAWLYLIAKPTPCTVLRLAAIRRGDRASCQALSCPIAVVGGGASLGDVKPPGLDISWSIDRVGTGATESYME